MFNFKFKDLKISKYIEQEYKRQEEGINLIASENYTSKSVMMAVGSILTNKYCEGYPGKRYYSGCLNCDNIEYIAIDRCKRLFNSDHVNVQPHSGSQANMAVYFSILNPGDKILGMNLSAGGHLTHGHAINFSGRFYNCIQYGVDKETELIDYEEIESLADRYKPKLIIAGASAYSRIIDFKRFAEIAKNSNAYLLVDMAHIAGLVAAGLHPDPVLCADFITSTTHKTLRGPRGGLILCGQQYAKKIDKAVMPGIQGGPSMNIIAAKALAFGEALKKNFINYQKQVIKNSKAMADEFKKLGYQIVSGGTDNHLFIINLSNRNLNGFEAEHALEQSGIYVSRSAVPFDIKKPYITSGIRIGSPAITTRGFNEHISLQVVHLVDEVLKNIKTTKRLLKVKKKVREICKEYPIYRSKKK